MYSMKKVYNALGLSSPVTKRKNGFNISLKNSVQINSEGVVLPSVLKETIEYIEKYGNLFFVFIRIYNNTKTN